MAIVIYSVNTEEFKNHYVNRNDLHIYKALAASQLVFNCGSLREAREKLAKILGQNFILHEGGHHLAILLRQEGTTARIPLVKLYSTKDKGPHQWEALQELSLMTVI
ncbi:MAG: hypothetical protein Q7S71_04735 [Candidatus Nitrotoga sp.]|nr:hypothetical protein [Candidatus Nitrotoga sp.]